MNNPDDRPKTTADWRKYPKGPNFLGIVLGASFFLLVALVVAYFLLRSDATKLMPHQNPTPNSLVQPLIPSHNGITAV